MLSFKPECTVYTYKVCHRTNPLKRVFFDFCLFVCRHFGRDEGETCVFPLDWHYICELALEEEGMVSRFAHDEFSGKSYLNICKI